MGRSPRPASVRSIAEALVVTDAAVKQHLGNLYAKFGIPDTVERRRVVLAREALRRGVVDVADAGMAAGSAPGGDDPLQAGRDAFARRDWDRCYATLSQADAAEPLGPEHLERAAEAGYWTNHDRESLGFKQRAFQANVQAGNIARAG